SGPEHASVRHGGIHRVGAHRPSYPAFAVVLGDRPGTPPRDRAVAGHGCKAQSSDDDRSRGSRCHHRAGRARRPRLRRRRAARVCTLAWLLLRARRGAVLMAAGGGAGSGRRPGNRFFRHPRFPRGVCARLAGAANGAVCAHSGRSAMTLSAHLLTKRYGAAPGYADVRGASLELRRGEFISIVGRAGSGKSTLMAMLGALTRPTEGRLLLDGTDVWALSETQRATFRARQVGFVFQFPSLLSNLTAVDNVAVPALLGRTMAAEDAYARARDLLARVGLADRMDAYPCSMSGGEQRRVAVARALINAPPLLLADEPTSDLDEDTESDIIDLLEHLQRTESFGFVLVTHDLELAKRAERSFEMRQGA